MVNEARMAIARKLLAERGETISVEEKAQEMRDSGECQTMSSAVEKIIETFSVVKAPAPDFEAIVLGTSAEGSRRRDAYLATEGGVLQVSGVPSGLKNFYRYLFAGVEANKNSASGREWLTVKETKDGGNVTEKGAVPYPEVVRFYSPFAKILGEGQSFLTKGSIKFVDKIPVDFDENAPKPKKGERLKTKPVYDPLTKTFGLKLTLVDGARQLNVKLTHEDHFRSVFPADENFDKFMDWVHRTTTDDEKRLEEIQALLRQGMEIVVFGRGGDTIRKKSKIPGQPDVVTKRSDPWFTIDQGGWVAEATALFETISKEAGSTAPGAPVSPAGSTAPPAPAAVRAPAIPAGATADPFADDANGGAKDLRTALLAKAKATGYVDAEVAASVEAELGLPEKSAHAEIVRLKTEGLLIKQGGKFVLAPAPAAGPAPPAGATGAPSPA